MIYSDKKSSPAFCQSKFLCVFSLEKKYPETVFLNVINNNIV
jgi:hypothetical protein